jgi:hypothetical protein
MTKRPLHHPVIEARQRWIIEAPQAQNHSVVDAISMLLPGQKWLESRMKTACKKSRFSAFSGRRRARQ